MKDFVIPEFPIELRACYLKWRSIIKTTSSQACCQWCPSINSSTRFHVLPYHSV